MRALVLLLLLGGCAGGADTGSPSVGVDSGDEDDGGDADSGGSGEDTAEWTGEVLYDFFCLGCHGPDGSGGTGGPDIRERVWTYSDADLAQLMQDGTEYMPAIEVSDAEALRVVEWIRENYDQPDSER